MDSLNKCTGRNCILQITDGPLECSVENCIRKTTVGKELIYWVSEGLTIEEPIGTPLDIRFQNLEKAIANAKKLLLPTIKMEVKND